MADPLLSATGMTHENTSTAVSSATSGPIATPASPFELRRLESLAAELLEARRALDEAEATCAHAIEAADPSWRPSARNLVHYAALRKIDLRETQRALASAGLSSLGRTEAHVMATLDAVLFVVHRLLDRAPAAPPPPIDFAHGERLLDDHTQALLGPGTRGRAARIMVTMPSEAADDPHLVRDLVAQGMDVMRVNAAHDGPEAWRKMIAHLRSAERELGRTCRAHLDLPGPKLRTGPLEPGPRVVRWRPERDALGAVTAAARVWLTPSDAPDAPDEAAAATLAIDRAWLARLEPGAEVSLRDLRGKRRALRVTAAHGASRWAETDETAYVGPGTRLLALDAGEALIGELPPLEQPIVLRAGDSLQITRDSIPGRNARRNARGEVIEAARVSCSLGQVFEDVRAGHRVWLDDGKIGGVVEEASPSGLRVRITQARASGAPLRADKGLNLPDTTLRIPALAAADREALAVAVEHADAVSLSFARSPADVAELQGELAARTKRRLGIVLKIETRAGFERLGDMLLTAMRTPPVGVMIARGDLAVECGFERMAEVQEELLWICEAAHVPVIWATQVLETLTKTGSPSRAEITDAAMGERAECVMLNKGAHVRDAVRVLDDILHRMASHQQKKTPTLRPLRSLHVRRDA